MKILFISRAYPPTVGGIENQNYELARHLAHIADVTLIANRYGKKFLPIFLPYALIRALIAMRTHDVLLLGDGVLGIVGATVRKLYSAQKKVFCVVHGLDLTFKNQFYQKWWVRTFIPACDTLLAVGNQTIAEGVARGISKRKFIFIPNGVNVAQFTPIPASRDQLAQILHRDITGQKILYTGGRLVRRKGVAWFIANVLPQLPNDILYVVSGNGPDREHIAQTIRDAHMTDRVIMLGYISDDTRHILLNTADIFIQPNIPIDGDMEGFGLVVLEASASEIPVVVAKLEGLKDAIHDEKNGFLVESQNAHAWKEKILYLLGDDFDAQSFAHTARQYTTSHFSWDKIAQKYYQEMQK